MTDAQVVRRTQAGCRARRGVFEVTTSLVAAHGSGVVSLVAFDEA
jgi:hypothetical protein